MRASARIPTVNPIRALLDRILTHFIDTLHMSLILKYSMTLRLPLLANRFLMKVPEKPPETSHWFEHEYSNLCEDPWAPFNSAQGFKLASWFMEGKVSKSRINQYFSSSLGDAESVGYRSMHTLENHL